MKNRFVVCPIKLLPNKHYFAIPQEKKQIYLHHTGGSSMNGSINRCVTKSEEIGLPFGVSVFIDRNGDICCTFPVHCSAFHLGLESRHLTAPNALSHRTITDLSIGIEMCTWGHLNYKNGRLFTYTGQEFVGQYVRLDAPYRGLSWFEAYSDAQLDSLGEILLYLNGLFGIPLKIGNVDRIFNVCPQAVQGVSGIYGHGSVRPAPEKFDVFPCPKLISLLKSF